MMTKLTVVICTYNRGEILRHCLDSLVSQSVPPQKYTVLIIDNNSTDCTSKIISSYTRQHRHFQGVVEKNQGLSYARNRAFKESKTEWISYLDDDGKAHFDFVENILDTIENYDFDIIGGRYHAWFLNERPKWFPPDWGSNSYMGKEIKVLTRDSYAQGGIMTIKSNVFDKVGGFDTDLGMKGECVYYGEEVLFQQMARKSGYVVGYNPNIEMDHLVREEKQNVRWYWESNFQAGLGATKTFDRKPRSLFILLIKFFGFVFLKIPPLLLKLIVSPKFHKEVFLIKSVGPLYYLAGQYKAKIGETYKV